ncbi:MAG TPA: hypothetical protein VJU58_07505 [Microbacterium sp.]|nr:hypothetical protein [Microbacterium sp.]
MGSNLGVVPEVGENEAGFRLFLIEPLAASYRTESGPRLECDAAEL